MKDIKLKVYENGDRYIEGGLASFIPLDIKVIEEYDLSNLTNDEIKELKKNTKDKKLLNKAKKI